MTKIIKDRWYMEKAIAMEAARDPKFKADLVSDPKSTLKKFFQAEKVDPSVLDQFSSIKVHLEAKNELQLSIPYFDHSKANIKTSGVGAEAPNVGGCVNNSACCNSAWLTCSSGS